MTDARPFAQAHLEEELNGAAKPEATPMVNSRWRGLLGGNDDPSEEQSSFVPIQILRINELESSFLMISKATCFNRRKGQMIFGTTLEDSENGLGFPFHFVSRSSVAALISSLLCKLVNPNSVLTTIFTISRQRIGTRPSELQRH